MDGIFILETNLDFESLSIANTLDSQNLTYSITEYSQQNGTLPICTDPNNPPNVSFDNINSFFYLKILGKANMLLKSSSNYYTVNIDRFTILTSSFDEIKLFNSNTQTSLPFIVVYS